jgi:hypothetical protein
MGTDPEDLEAEKMVVIVPSDRVIGTDEIALVPLKLFDVLPEYSCSLPTGQRFGKRWLMDRSFGTPRPPSWVLGEYEDINDPALVGIRWRDVEILEVHLLKELARSLAP